MKAPDVLVARLGGAVHAQVAVVRHKGEHYFVAPEKLGGVQEVPADSLTDCLNWSVWDLNEKIRKEDRKRSEE